LGACIPTAPGHARVGVRLTMLATGLPHVPTDASLARQIASVAEMGTRGSSLLRSKREVIARTKRCQQLRREHIFVTLQVPARTDAQTERVRQTTHVAQIQHARGLLSRRLHANEADRRTAHPLRREARRDDVAAARGKRAIAHLDVGQRVEITRPASSQVAEVPTALRIAVAKGPLPTFAIVVIAATQ